MALSLYFSYTCLYSRFTVYLVIFTLLQFVWFYLLIQTLKISKQKQISWLTTMTSSVVMTISSLPYLVEYLKMKDLRDFAMLDSPSGNVLIAFFMSYLIADLVLGYLHYPTQMGLATGWIHHTLYLILLPMFVSSKLSGGFMIAAFLEFPTVFLALGNLNENYRAEYLFGFSFFATRIVFHLYYGYRIHLTTPELLWPIILTVPLHLHWFYSWARRQFRLKGLEKAALASNDVSFDICTAKRTLPNSPSVRQTFRRRFKDKLQRLIYAC
jgi:hypothetical protein